MTPIHEYLVSGLLPEDLKESRKIRVKAPQYKLIRGNLYRRSFYTPWLRCVASPQTDDIVKEVHEGSCGFKAEPRSMVVRITKQGYYWPSMHRDASKVLQDCEKCKEQSAIRKVADNSAITDRSIQKDSYGNTTLPRNSQKETPFSLTYGSEAIIPISKNDVAKDDRGRIKEVYKRRGSKEIASIEEAYYRRKLRRNHNKRSSHSIYKIGDFVYFRKTTQEARSLEDIMKQVITLHLKIDIKATHEPNTTKFNVRRDVVGPHMSPTENKHP
ncbi:reverse transcriptase domain-containing protein [Tanacetum coccineum]|uniref:Reverse transcriptase domain-containing protein n=1 Tax=Tanacetum coccineum TaxID=301880 RepID=A0ABQ5EL06_9ASTR